MNTSPLFRTEFSPAIVAESAHAQKQNAAFVDLKKAIQNKENLARIKILIKECSIKDLEALEYKINGLIHRLPNSGHPNLAEIYASLGERGVNIGAPNCHGHTPAHIILQDSCQISDSDKIKVLVALRQHGADLYAKDNWGKTPENQSKDAASKIACALKPPAVKRNLGYTESAFLATAIPADHEPVRPLQKNLEETTPIEAPAAICLPATSGDFVRAFKKHRFSGFDLKTVKLAPPGRLDAPATEVQASSIRHDVVLEKGVGAWKDEQAYRDARYFGRGEPWAMSVAYGLGILRKVQQLGYHPSPALWNHADSSGANERKLLSGTIHEHIYRDSRNSPFISACEPGKPDPIIYTQDVGIILKFRALQAIDVHHALSPYNKGSCFANEMLVFGHIPQRDVLGFQAVHIRDGFTYKGLRKKDKTPGTFIPFSVDGDYSPSQIGVLAGLQPNIDNEREVISDENSEPCW